MSRDEINACNLVEHFSGIYKVLNNHKRDLHRQTIEIADLKALNAEHKKLNGELRIQIDELGRAEARYIERDKTQQEEIKRLKDVAQASHMEGWRRHRATVFDILNRLA